MAFRVNFLISHADQIQHEQLRMVLGFSDFFVSCWCSGVRDSGQHPLEGRAGDEPSVHPVCWKLELSACKPGWSFDLSSGTLPLLPMTVNL